MPHETQSYLSYAYIKSFYRSYFVYFHLQSYLSYAYIKSANSFGGNKR